MSENNIDEHDTDATHTAMPIQAANNTQITAAGKQSEEELEKEKEDTAYLNERIEKLESERDALSQEKEQWKYSSITTTVFFIIFGHIAVYFVSKWHKRIVREKVEETKAFWKNNFRIVNQSRERTKQARIANQRQESNQTGNQLQRQTSLDNPTKPKFTMDDANNFLKFVESQGLSHALQTNEYNDLLVQKMNQFRKRK